MTVKRGFAKYWESRHRVTRPLVDGYTLAHAAWRAALRQRRLVAPEKWGAQQAQPATCPRCKGRRWLRCRDNPNYSRACPRCGGTGKQQA